MVLPAASLLYFLKFRCCGRLLSYKVREILQDKYIVVLGCAVGACLVLLLMLGERYRLLALIISVSWLMFIATRLRVCKHCE